MKIILRKRDSVVSIVLFIFNVYNEYTGRYSMKLDHLIKCMSFFDKNESATRMGLSRMVKAEILSNKKIDNDVYYELTSSGVKSLQLWNSGVARFYKRFSFRQKPWDNRWYMLTLLNLIRSENQGVVDELSEMGFREVTKDLFVSSYPMQDEVRELLGKQFEFLDFWGDIALNNNSREVLEKIYGLEALRKQYGEFLILGAEIRDKMTKTTNLGEHLPLLFELGWNFYDIAVNDPALPKAFLKDWIGDKAAAEMNELRGFLYSKVSGYFAELICNG